MISLFVSLLLVVVFVLFFLFFFLHIGVESDNSDYFAKSAGAVEYTNCISAEG